MIRRTIKMIISVIAILILLICVCLGAARIYAILNTSGRTYSPETVPQNRVAVVFGAGLWRDGTPTPVLQDRVKTAAQLYFAGKVEKILLSGDNRYIYYNEPEAMRQYGLKLGIPDDVMVLDYAGRRTYDTCYRAKAIFGVEHAILVTQQFHLPRALMTCNGLGLSADGAIADSREYNRASVLYWNIRELPATFVALWEINISRPLPVLGQPEPIFPASSDSPTDSK